MSSRPHPMPTGQLRLISTSDLHMHLIPFDYLHERMDAPRGLAALAPEIARARAQCAANLLCDAGDFLQGSPLADEIAIRRSRPHPMIQTFNALRYDAVTLGNHDFDYGLPYLQEVLADATPAVISANLRTGPTTTLVRPWAIIDRAVVCSDGATRPLRVGVIGFAPPQIPVWSADLLAGTVQADDILASARTHLPQMRRDGADIVVALCHGGPVAGPEVCHMENAALQLARLPGIDAVLMGHMHGLFPGCGFDGIADVDAARGTLAGKPAVMAGSRGQALGVLDLIVAPAGVEHRAETGSGWRVVDHRVMVRRVPTTPVHRTALIRSLRQVLAAPHVATLERLRQPLGLTERPLNTYFAALGHDDSAPLLAHVQRAAIRARLVGTPFADLPVLASTAPFHAGGHGGPHHYLDIPAGPLRVRDCAAIVPFDNPVCAVLRRGWQIMQWLERSSAFFRTLRHDVPDQPLLDPLVAPYHFDTIHGLSYVIDLSADAAPGAGRIRDVMLDSRPLADDDLCVVATNSYRARGGGGLVVAEPSDILHTTRHGLRSLLMDALKAGLRVPSATSRAWAFAPLVGASALVPSSPAARSRLRDLPHVTFDHLQADGFAAYRVDLS